MNKHISITLTGDSEIQKLNKKYLKRDFPTDVLSFEIKEVDEDGSELLGEIVVNTEQARRQSADYGTTYEEEISQLIAHGVLHLLGVHHPDDDDVSVHGVASGKRRTK